MPYENNKGADQPAHPRSLISTFIVHCLDSLIPLVSISKISSLYLASLAGQAGLCLTWSQTPKTGFLLTRLISKSAEVYNGSHTKIVVHGQLKQFTQFSSFHFQVLFLPNRPGAFVAEVLVFSQLFLRNEKDTIDGIPVSVTFQAIAEKPKIVVRLFIKFVCTEIFAENSP